MWFHVTIQCVPDNLAVPRCKGGEKGAAADPEKKKSKENEMNMRHD